MSSSSKLLGQITDLIKRRCTEILPRHTLGSTIIGTHISGELMPLVRLVIAAEIDSARNRLNLEDGGASQKAAAFRTFYDSPDWTAAAEAFLDCFKGSPFRTALRERLFARDGGKGVGTWMGEQPGWTASFNGILTTASRIELLERMFDWIDTLVRYLPALVPEFRSVPDLQAEFDSSEAAAIALADRMFAALLDTLTEECPTWGSAPELTAEYIALFAAMKADIST